MNKKQVSLKFAGQKTEVIFSTFINFLNTLNIELEVVVKDNKAFFNRVGCPFVICVYPFRDDLLYFEYSTNLSKDIDLNSSIPVQISKPYDLEIIKPITKLILALSKVSITSVPKIKQEKVNFSNNTDSTKSINRFFKNNK